MVPRRRQSSRLRDGGRFRRRPGWRRRFHQVANGDAQAKQPAHWVGVGNACSTTSFHTDYFPTDALGTGPVWFEVHAAGRTYWLELPDGLARAPSAPAANEPARGETALPSYLQALTEDNILIPWATVRYPLGGAGFLDVIDACDGVARVTLNNDGTQQSIDQPSLGLTIRRPDGAVFKGREISRSISPRQSTFDFRSRGGTMAHTWDAMEIRVDSARNVVMMPSSLYLLGLRLANWGDPHRVPVPDANCKD